MTMSASIIRPEPERAGMAIPRSVAWPSLDQWQVQTTDVRLQTPRFVNNNLSIDKHSACSRHLTRHIVYTHTSQLLDRERRIIGQCPNLEDSLCCYVAGSFSTGSLSDHINGRRPHKISRKIAYCVNCSNFEEAVDIALNAKLNLKAARYPWTQLELVERRKPSGQPLC